MSFLVSQETEVSEYMRTRKQLDYLLEELVGVIGFGLIDGQLPDNLVYMHIFDNILPHGRRVKLEVRLSPVSSLGEMAESDVCGVNATE